MMPSILPDRRAARESRNALEQTKSRPCPVRTHCQDRLTPRVTLRPAQVRHGQTRIAQVNRPLRKRRVLSQRRRRNCRRRVPHNRRRQHRSNLRRCIRNRLDDDNFCGHLTLLLSHKLRTQKIMRGSCQATTPRSLAFTRNTMSRSNSAGFCGGASTNVSGHACM